MKNTPTPSNSEADLRAMNEQLLSRIELLTKQLEDSERARSLAEMRTAQLSSKLAASKESLQQFGANWFTPSSITSLTFEEQIGVCPERHPDPQQGGDSPPGRSHGEVHGRPSRRDQPGKAEKVIRAKPVDLGPTAEPQANVTSAQELRLARQRRNTFADGTSSRTDPASTSAGGRTSTATQGNLDRTQASVARIAQENSKLPADCQPSAGPPRLTMFEPEDTTPPPEQESGIRL